MCPAVLGPEHEAGLRADGMHHQVVGLDVRDTRLEVEVDDHVRDVVLAELRQVAEPVDEPLRELRRCRVRRVVGPDVDRVREVDRLQQFRVTPIAAATVPLEYVAYLQMSADLFKGVQGRPPSASRYSETIVRIVDGE
ncbi:hypothetical protein GCM10009555_085680 [Acrocarpospora macrocephala]|uniref:Uncharacterized protein n=1 Tax=Acrocarpospora macrocephala TaxID=150177 RepID=A0A5M3WYN1_9ACTN|nr:hypothetical protein Amac_074670 [Acrocarpospora macrocephala]